jgi:Diacylglycerol acyltransferase
MPNEKGTTLYKVQKKFQNVFGFTLPLFHGRGILNCRASLSSLFVKLTALSDNWGLLPYRRQIIAVSESPVVCRAINRAWALTSPNSWPASACSEDRQPERRADQGGTRGIHNGAVAVRGAHLLIRFGKVTDFQIWLEGSGTLTRTSLHARVGES